MSTKGTPRSDELAVARINLDFLTNPARIYVLCAFIDTSTGQTIAWTQTDGNTFSKETLEKMIAFRTAIEEDIVRVMCGGSATVTARTPQTPPAGIGEHVDNSKEPRQA